MLSSNFLLNTNLKLAAVAMLFVWSPVLHATAPQPQLYEASVIVNTERIEKVSAVDTRTLESRLQTGNQTDQSDNAAQITQLHSSSVSSLPAAMILLVSGLLVLRSIRR